MLTNLDVQELTEWFGSPAPIYIAGRLAAQTYEPRVGGDYDPTTDMRLENLVSAAVMSGKSEWSRIKRVLDELTPEHRDILRRAFGPRPIDALVGYAYPEVALVTPTALERARTEARDAEHRRLLEVAQTNAIRDRCSPMTVAIRVLTTDQIACVVVTEDMIAAAAHRLLARAEVELRVMVKLEMLYLVDEAGDAYRAARAALGATRRQAKAERRKANEAALDEALGRKRRKEADRFEAKLRAAS